MCVDLVETSAAHVEYLQYDLAKPTTLLSLHDSINII